MKFIQAKRLDEHTVKATHEVNGELLTVTWNNVNPGTGKIEFYDLDFDAESNNPSLVDDARVAIKMGECDDNPHIELYLQLRDGFDHMDCQEL